MAFKLAELFVQVGAKMGPVNAALAGLRTKLAGLAAMRISLPGGGLTAALGIGAGVAAISQAISGASNLAETVSKIDQVFGPAGAKIKSFADEMATAFGLPKREMLDAASNFGLIFTGAGIAEDRAADMAVKMAKLAADCSSFYNVPVPDALEKIRAGLTGESEPLKAFGVLMSEDAVKAKGLALGLVKAGKEMDEQSKVQARLALITEKTSKASGDLERTQNGAANQTRKFWGTLQNLGDTLGTVILPAATAAIGLFNEMATDLSTAATSSTGAWSGFVGFFTGAIDTAGLIYRNFGDIIERTGVMIGGSLTNAWEYLAYGGEVAAATADFIGRVLGEGFVAVVTMAANLKDNLLEIFAEIWAYIRSGGKDPIEFKMKPILDGVGFQAPEFKLPELVISSVDNQLAEIDRRMTEREAERGAKKLAAEQKAAAAGNAAAGPAGKGAAAASKHTNLISDADSYAKDLQEAALMSSDDKQSKMLGAMEGCRKLLEETRDAVKKNAGKRVGAWG